MTSIKNLKFAISLFLHKMGIQIMFDEPLVKKQDSPWFWTKIGNFLFVFFYNKISREIMPHDHLVRKQALLDYKKKDFT